MSSHADSRTVQDYIDETPSWRDGTQVTDTPMTKMQFRIWGLASAGKFFEGLVVFMTGVALPLIDYEFNVTATEKGFISAASLFGILIGATLLGGLSDRFGRKGMFFVEMVIFTVFLVGVTLSPNVIFLIICLFGMGLALGCDYPTAHLMISESIPTRSRGKLVLSAFAFQSVGAFTGTIIGFLILHAEAAVSDWRWMFATAIIPAVLVTIGRLFITQSPHWLISVNRHEEAQQETRRLLARSPEYPNNVVLRKAGSGNEQETEGKVSIKELFNKKNRRATILASVPWFLQDLGTYGIGIFTPTIVAATAGQQVANPTNIAQIVHNDMIGARGSAIIDVLLIVGIVAAIIFADRLGRTKLQIWGFIGCAIGLLIAAFSTYLEGAGQTVLVFAGFMLFNFMTNFGPNAMTYLVAGEVFPTRVRGTGAGFAASFAKIGAVLTAFLFPILLKDIGTAPLLYILVGTSILGAFVTWKFQIETKGLNLETLGTDHEELPHQNTPDSAAVTANTSASANASTDSTTTK